MANNEQVVLELKNISKLYAGTIALNDVNFRVCKGEVHGLIGKNGAGKSTLVGIISGIIQPSMGKIIVNGNIFDSFSPSEAKKQRISIITQEPQVIEESTVAENFFMPGYLGNKQIINWRKIEQQAAEILNEAKFPIDVTRKVRDLSISERQLLLVIKACYVEQADIIIMDEVSASLTQKDQQTLYQIIQDRIAAQKTIIFISHHTEELLRVCDKLTVLRDGCSVGSAYSSDLDLKSLSSLIVGETTETDSAIVNQINCRDREVLFELKNFTNYGKFQDINLQLHKGEIVGIAGLRGSGRTEIMKSIIGVDPFDCGIILLQGVEKKYKMPSEAEKDGILYLAEEREAEGLIGIASIKQNITVSILSLLGNKGFINSPMENTKSDELIDKLSIKSYSRDQLINQLSGGNKQKVMVGRIIAREPLVCLLDEPTRGVDIEAKESILNTIQREMRGESCVLITSPGIEDLIKICDRILVLYKGKIIDVFERKDFNEQDIYRATQGEVIHMKEVAVQ